MRFLKRAFTLIEIAVVLVIISILISMVAGFLPKIIETFKLKRAISYVQDNLDYLKAAITREGILSKENLPHYLAHKVDIWGRPFYYKVPDNLADKSICVASHTNLYVCIVKDFEKFTEKIKNYNPKNYNYFSCKNIGGDLVETAVVLLSSGKNGNIQTPILILDDNECESQDTCYVVPYLKNVPPAALVDYYLKVNSNYIISSDEEKWILATNPSLLADKDISSNMEYDDIVSYLPLDIAKSNCPSKQVIGNIERFWVEPQDPKVNENVTFHWIATLSGVGINLDKVRCILDFGDGNLATYSGFNKCLGYQKRNHKYKKAGIFTPILKIYDDQGNLILVKTTNVYVKGASGGCTVDNFKAYVLDNGTFKEIADASTQDAYANVTVPATIKYTWNITYNSCPNEDKSCFISFGDGTTQKFNDCSSIKEVIHTYQYSGDYVAKLFVACGCESNKITLSARYMANFVGNITGNATSHTFDPPPHIEEFSVNPIYGQAPQKIKIRYRVIDSNDTIEAWVLVDGNKICHRKGKNSVHVNEDECFDEIKTPGIHSVYLIAKDSHYNYVQRLILVYLLEDISKPQIIYAPWAPPPGQVSVIKVKNPNDYDLTNYKIKVDAFPIVDCIGLKFKITTADGTKNIPYCFERADGSCGATFCDPINNTNCTDPYDKNFWTGNIWLKGPKLPAKSDTILVAYPDDTYNAVDNLGNLTDKSQNITYTIICYTSQAWTPPPIEEIQGCSVKLTVTNLGNCILTNYQLRLNISDPSLKACLSSLDNSSKPSFAIYENDDFDKPLPYCFETANGECKDIPDDWNSVKYIWVKIPNLLANDFIYLTLQQVPDEEEKNNVNGTQVFDFYDDFNGNDLDLTRWEVLNAEGLYKVENGALQMWGNWNNKTHAFIKSRSTHSFEMPFIVEERVKVNQTGDNDLFLLYSNLDNKPFNEKHPVRINYDTSNKSEKWMDSYSLCVNGNCEVAKISDTYWHYLKHRFENGKFISEIYPKDSISDEGKPLASLMKSGNISLREGFLYLGGDTDSTSIIDYVDWIRVRRAACGPVIVSNVVKSANITLHYPACTENMISLVLINTKAFGFDNFRICADLNKNGKCDSTEPLVKYCYYLSDGRCTAYKYDSWTGYIYVKTEYTNLVAEFDKNAHGVDGSEWFKIGSALIEGYKEQVGVKVKNFDSNSYDNYPLRITIPANYLKKISGSDYFSYFKVDKYEYKENEIYKTGKLLEENLPFCYEEASGNCTFQVSLSTVTDGKGVFDFYDDFDDNNLEGWILDEGLSYSLENGILTIDQDKGLAYELPFKFQDGYMSETKVRVEEDSAKGNWYYSGVFASPMSSKYTAGYNANKDATILYMTKGDRKVYVWIGDGSEKNYNIASAININDVASGNWEIRGVTVIRDTVYLTKNGDNIYNKSDITWHKDLRYLRLGYFTSGNGNSDYLLKTSYDWVRVRKYHPKDAVKIAINSLPDSYLTLNNTGESIDNYQLRVELEKIPAHDLYLVEDDNDYVEDGYIAPVPYCYEQKDGSCKAYPRTKTIWMKIPELPSNKKIYIYHVEDPIYRKINKDLTIWVKTGIDEDSFYLIFSKDNQNNAVSGDEIKVNKNSNENIAIDINTYYVPTEIDANYPIKIDISSLPDKNFVLTIEDTSQPLKYCFYHPETLECNKKPSDYIYTKLPLSIEPAQKKELIFTKVKSSNKYIVTGKDIFTLYDDFYDDFSSDENWEHDNSDVTEGKLKIEQDGSATYKYTLNGGFYYIELKVDEIVNNILKISCGGDFVTFIKEKGIYKLYSYCEGKFVLSGVNPEGDKIVIDTIVLREGDKGDLEFVASSFSKNIKSPISPVVEINGVSHEIWSKIYNPNNKELENYQFPIDNIAWIKARLGLGENGSFYLKDIKDTSINYCFEQENGECNQTPTDKRIWVKMSFKPSSSKWLRFIAYKFASGKPAGLENEGKISRDSSYLDPYTSFELISSNKYEVKCKAYKLSYTGDKILNNYQINLNDVSFINSNSNYLILNYDGKYVNYCFEKENGECKEDIPSNTRSLWLKYPQILQNSDKYLPDGIASTNKFITYKIKSPNPPKQYASNPKLVFDFYDDFNNYHKEDDWQIGWEKMCSIGNGNVKMENDSLVITGFCFVREKKELNLPNKVCIEALVKAKAIECVAPSLAPTNKFKVNYCSLYNGYEFDWWGWRGYRRSGYHGIVIVKEGKLEKQLTSEASEAENGKNYFIGGCYDGEILYHYYPYLWETYDPTNNIIFDIMLADTLFSGENWKRIYLRVASGATWAYDWVRVRKYSKVKPILLSINSTTKVSCLDWLLRKDYEYKCQKTNHEGIYNCQIDPDGDFGQMSPFTATCDMKTKGGGWMLVLNYLHKGGTNPKLKTWENKLPIIGSTDLGKNEAGTIHWGHASNDLMQVLNKVKKGEYRFYCKTSNHDRTMHFITEEPSVDAYFTSGKGRINVKKFKTNYTPLPDHTANLPESADEGFSDQEDKAMTEFPFYKSAKYHWGIKGLGSRWECDDYPNNYSQDTYHQIWVR